MAIAYVLVNCEYGKENNVLETLKKIDSIKEVKRTFGAYDIILKVESSKLEKLRKEINSNIRSTERVRSILTLMGVKHVKN